MKQFLITNPRYTGEAILLYNESGVLFRIDTGETDMQPDVIAHFKYKVPVLVDGLKTAFSAETNVVEKALVVSFEAFWKKYDHKFNRDRCEALWKRMSKSDQVLSYYKLDLYHRYLRKNATQIKMHPDTYLRNKAWLNDYRK